MCQLAPAGVVKFQIPKHFIGALKKEKKKEKGNQYKLKKAMAIAIGLITNCTDNNMCLKLMLPVNTGV